MKTLTEYMVTEGLIKVPKELLVCLFEYIATEYVSYLYINGYEYLAKQAADYAKVKIDKNFIPVNRSVECSYIIDDLPDKIKNQWHFEIGQLRLIIDWDGKIWGSRPKVNASFEESDANGYKDHFTINPLAFKNAVKEGICFKELKDILDKLKFSLWHEVSHAVQHGALKWLDKNQIYKSRIVRDNPNSSKEERRKEYLSSQVEYDPTIKTKIFQFRQKFDITDTKNIRRQLAAFVGVIEDVNIKPDEFFKVLKETDIKKWQRAVKKFYLNFDFDIEKLFINA